MNATNTYAIDSFAERASRYCEFCEKTVFTSHHASQLSAFLCSLYEAALQLPKVGLGYWDDELPDVPESQLAIVKANLSDFNGFYYSQYFDPDPKFILTSEPSLGDVGDDLLDIYQDLKRGLLDFQLGKKDGALWYWSRMHSDHWGRHAVGAIFALHCLVISKDVKNEL
ncbi:MAG: DUF5063 domain-containing protein [Burkholderiales bacterium]|nr:DUF5063 domain-containing protein [Burkholderiales bacterium]